jgi:hypothetical protein
VARQAELQAISCPVSIRDAPRDDHCNDPGYFHISVLLSVDPHLQRVLDRGLLNYLHDPPNLLLGPG